MAFFVSGRNRLVLLLFLIFLILFLVCRFLAISGLLEELLEAFGRLFLVTVLLVLAKEYLTPSLL